MYEWITFFFLFIIFYTFVMVMAYILDKVLRYTCNRGIFPKDYFKL